MQGRPLLVAEIVHDVQSKHLGNERKPSYNFLSINVTSFSSISYQPLYFGKQDLVKTGFQIEVQTLIQHLTENRLRHSRGPVHYIESVT